MNSVRPKSSSKLPTQGRRRSKPPGLAPARPIVVWRARPMPLRAKPDKPAAE